MNIVEDKLIEPLLNAIENHKTLQIIDFGKKKKKRNNFILF